MCQANYEPLQVGSEGAAELKKLLNRTPDELVSKAAPSRLDLKPLYVAVNREVKQIVMNGNVLYGDSLTNYVASIANRLTESRPSMKGTYKIYILKNTVVNAFTFPDGTILITTGLISRLRTESQLAFILGHELAHLIKKHGEQSFVKEYSLKKQFNLTSVSGSNAFNVLMHYSQEFEMEADAMGIELTSNAGYNYREASSALIATSFNDTLYDYVKLDFKKSFSSKDFNVDSSMMKKNADNISIGSSDQNGNDENSTHPNLDKRTIAINEIIEHLNSTPSIEKYDSSLFISFRYKARMENILVSFNSGNYVESMYLCMRWLHFYPENTWLQVMCARNILWLANYRPKEETEDKSRKNDNYGYYCRQLEGFLGKLSGSDLKKLSYSYIKSCALTQKKNEELTFYVAFVSDFYLGSGISRIYFNEYLKQYPHGKYAGFAENKLK